MGFYHHFRLEMTKSGIFLGQDTRKVRPSFLGELAGSSEPELRVCVWGAHETRTDPLLVFGRSEGGEPRARFLGQSASRLLDLYD